MMMASGGRAALTLGLFAAPLVAHGQQGGKVYRVGTMEEKSSDPDLMLQADQVIE